MLLFLGGQLYLLLLATSPGVAKLLALCAAGQECAWARKFADELDAEQGNFKGTTKRS